MNLRPRMATAEPHGKLFLLLFLLVMPLFLADGTASAQNKSSLSILQDDICSRPAEGSAIVQPPELHSSNGILEVSLHYFLATERRKASRFCYLTPQGAQSPTLRVHPGDTLLIHFFNDLTADDTEQRSALQRLRADEPLASLTAQQADAPCSGRMGAYSTNLHFHGLSLPPVCHQDEVLKTLIMQGERFDYRIHIPADEPPGLYWYHPHPHGFGNAQVQGGASGAIIVEGLDGVLPLTPAARANLAEQTLILRDQLVPEALAEKNAADPKLPGWDISLNYVPILYPEWRPALFPVEAGQRQLWRVLNAAANTIFHLRYLIDGIPQPLQVAAIDGVPLRSSTGKILTNIETSLELPPAARVEFLVTTPRVGARAELVTTKIEGGQDADSNPARPIATIVAHAAVKRVAQAPISATALPQPLSAAPATIQRHLYFSEEHLQPNQPEGPTRFYLTVEGQTPALYRMDAPPAIVTHQGVVEEWTVENRTLEVHTFHLHQLHFRVVARNGRIVSDAATRDTVEVPYWSGHGPYPSIRIRVDLRQPGIIGTFVYHCHILDHEDNGMMGAIQVLPAVGARSSASFSRQ